MRILTRCVWPARATSSLPFLREIQYENDYDIGVAVIDSYTHYVLEFMEGINKTSQTTMEDLVRNSILYSLARTHCVDRALIV